RNRDAVIRKNDHAKRAPFEGDTVDLKTTIVVDRRGDLFEVGSQAAGIDLADEDLGEARLRGRSGSSTSPTLRIVDGESRLVQIALELKAGLLDELLVFRIAGNRRQLAGGVEGANPLQIDVEETVRAREQASRFGRSVLAQGHDQRDGGHNQQNGQGDGKAASNAHRVSEGARVLRCE